MYEAETAIETVLPGGQLGAPGHIDPQLCSARAIRLLAEAAGEGVALTSVSVDLGSASLDVLTNVRVETRIDRRTRSIVFVSLVALDGEAVVFSARGLFSAKG